MRKSVLNLAFLFPFTAFAQYHLLSPVPKDQMREFETERPDKTRTAYTVDAGHFYIETDLFDYSQHDEEAANRLKLLDTNFRFGLTENLELQILPDVYVRESGKDGFGQTSVGLKYNVFGNQHGLLTMALFPYVIAPTSGADLQDKRWEGGLAIPFDYQLPGNWELEFMVEANNVREDSKIDWQTNFIQSASLGHTFMKEELKVFLEVYNELKANKDESNETTLDLAFQFELVENVMVDTGAFLGVSPGAKDLEYFTGLSYAF